MERMESSRNLIFDLLYAFILVLLMSSVSLSAGPTGQSYFFWQFDRPSLTDIAYLSANCLLPRLLPTEAPKDDADLNVVESDSDDEVV